MPRLLLAAIFFVATAAHGAGHFSFSNPPGPHAVGVKFVQQYDRTRLFKRRIDAITGEPARGERARPVQTIVWYPAARGGKPLAYRDYLETMATEDEFARGAEQVRRLTDERIEGNAGSRREALLREVAAPMRAVRDARAQDGKYPVVIYAPSFSASAIENVDLCEYLASQGYIVLSSASLGAYSRPMTLDLEGLETQAADISFLIGYAATLPQADTGRVAVAGFSWGGLANVLAAAKDERIKALVSLDGSLRGYPQFVDGGKDAAKYVTPERITVPLLYLGARPRTLEDLSSRKFDLRYSFMNQMKYADVYIVSLLPMTHGDFSSYGVRMSQDDGFGDYTREEVELAHSWAGRYVRHFLDAYLKGNAEGLAFVNNKPAANKAPRHMISADIRRKKESAPPTLEHFAERLAAEGFDKAVSIHEEFTRRGATFKLGPNEIYGWGAQLARIDRPEQAREVFRLGTHLHPEMGFIHDGLAEMQAKTGQVQEAVKTYRRVLELDPANADAMRYLKTHGAAAGASAP
ncbi:MULTISPECIES: CocE/NonD family hydrolase [unclassified Massilia]|uniref:CocE/NonD family hydrolase n=1 Tax=unclassified Massilia TaxID=2609279 RepID=UPI001B813F0E|nr:MULTISPECIES: CocE/NonD family hydrolase [unclassified Massilia]MBQ5942771.1 dienelactone hydrolase family protein [Massilia sp. AB1]MBQ5963998.1 dienelactone hydrolase family protein [Massilia sp. ZL223]